MKRLLMTVGQFRGTFPTVDDIKKIKTYRR